LVVWAPYTQIFPPPSVVSSFPAPNVAPAIVDASSWVTNWHGSRLTGDADPVGDAGAVVDGLGVGEALLAGAGGGSGVGVADAGVLVAGAGAVVAAVARAETCVFRTVVFALFEDLQPARTSAGMTTTTIRAVFRMVEFKTTASGGASVVDYVATAGRRVSWRATGGDQPSFQPSHARVIDVHTAAPRPLSGGFLCASAFRCS
jgi:hypothetical protein